jgi:CDP-4-dehydro-6-deoxyglucose reductase
MQKDEMSLEYSVTIESSNDAFKVDTGETVLDAALRQGILLPHGCRGGFCGSCLGEVISGEVVYTEGLPDGLSEEDAAAGKALFCKASAISDLTIKVPEYRKEKFDIKMLPARIEQLQKLNHDVMLVELKLPEHETFRYMAGQYIDILLKDGRRRSFSMASPPGEGHLLQLHIRRVPGGYFTGQVFETLKEKDILRIEGPLGSFWFRDDSPRQAILVAGGTGFAPIKAIIEQQLASGSTRPLHFFWGVRASQDLYMRELVEAWDAEYPNFHFIPVLSEPAAEEQWEGETGFVHEAVARRFPALGKFDVYLCGPPPMIDAARERFSSQGLPDTQIFSDSFEFSNE